MDRNQTALELNKVLDRLAEKTSCEDTAQMARDLRPTADFRRVAKRLDETDDAMQLMARFGAPSFGAVKNVQSTVRRAEAGAALSMRELLDIAELLRVFRGVADWHARRSGVETSLDGRFDGVIPNKYLEEKISTAILSEDTVADNASPTLADIRRKIRSASTRLRDHLDSMIRSAAYQRALQDPIVTIRDGRFVVPVKAEHRGEIAGLVHDTSASGATVFIEPMAVVEANNEIRLLQSQEEAEIERILAELSADAGAFAGSICSGYKCLLELDLIFAKAALAYDMKASRPTLTEDGHLLLRHARHPLIDKQKVVPVDVELGADFDTLVVTGPNTGGKTVTLKTLGLLTLMTMCGLLPPVDDGSVISTFDHVLVDIGDEQSIEQSLSTFSAHMKNLIAILKATDERSLVLVDELGAGTDPVEGAALAIAILERLREKGARVAATTHYAELKAYAVATPGVENGSCEFDVKTLKPTYRLLVGVPGRSNAFAISERLGMDAELVERARSLVSGDDRRMEEVVVRLDERRQALESELAEARETRSSAQREAAAAKARVGELETARQAELDAAREKARQIVERARLDAEHLMEELDRLRKQKNKAGFADAAADAKSRLRAELRRMEQELDPVDAKPGEAYTLPRPLKAGDTVRLSDLGKQGTVVTPPDKSGLTEVLVGIVRTRVPTETLRLCEPNEPAAKKPRAGARQTKPSGGTESGAFRRLRDVHTEVDLRGMAADEGLLELDRFLDGAVMSGLSVVTVIHGKGTGILRSAVQKHLKTHPSVKSFRLGTYGEGEDGVTVVELK